MLTEIGFRRTGEQLAVDVDIVVKTKVTRTVNVPQNCTPQELEAALRSVREKTAAEVDNAMLDIVDLDNNEDFDKHVSASLALF